MRKRTRQLDLEFEHTYQINSQDDDGWLRREKSLEECMAEWRKKRKIRQSEGCAVGAEDIRGRSDNANRIILGEEK